MKKICFVWTLLVICFLPFAVSEASMGRNTILFVPLDNRPVCLDYAVETMKAAGWNVETPPLEYIAGNDHSGDPDKLYEWLAERSAAANAIVVSSDALIYGGLVDSRTHHLPQDILAERAERLLNLKTLGGDPLIYVFTTIMRSPKASSAPVEPAYYAEWGPKLFRLGALEDKLDLKEISRKERRELAALQAEIPQAVQEDRAQRRSLNIATTELLLHGVESGNFDYLLIGRDDTAPYSQAHKEARKMDILVRELPKEKIRFFSGADQLGLLLLSRAASRVSYEIPMIYVDFADGKGGATIPTYEDDPIAFSASEHIHAAGGWPTAKLARADLVLAVNTPFDGVTLEASSPTNDGVLTKHTERFAADIKSYLKQGKPVAVADVAYGNGADNALVKELFQEQLAEKLAAYGGWNTAGNTLGFALAQGLLAKKMDTAERLYLLDVRYLDDWAYQANVRNKTYVELIWPNYWPNSGLNTQQVQEAEAVITKDILEIAKPVLGERAKDYNFILPWQRMFEVEVSKK
ncbi:DUF4127 family protein [Phascolarctobacterium sp.]